MLKEGHITRCVVCHAVLDLRDEEPSVHFEGTGGHRTQRVLSIRGDEIHRCDLLAPPPARRAR
jgi:hypothetical protein